MLDNKSLRKLSQNLESCPEDYMTSFRHNLFMYINQKNISLADIADAADMSLSTLRSFVYGDSSDCHVSTVVKLARALKISVDELIGCGTISPQTCESLQLVRQLPESFTHFVRWAIQYHYGMINTNQISYRSVEVMTPICSDNGNLTMTNDFDIIDISNLPDETRPKVFMGIRMPCDHYIPHYYEGDILLIANDRSSRRSEHIIVTVGKYMWIVNQRVEIENGTKVSNFYSLRDNRRRAGNDDVGLIIGYVADVIRCMDEAE